MHYFIEKSRHAPSGIALIISFEDFTEKKDSIMSYTYYYPEDYKVLHDEAAHLGGTVDDVLGNGVSLTEILNARELIKKVI